MLKITRTKKKSIRSGSHQERIESNVGKLQNIYDKFSEFKLPKLRDLERAIDLIDLLLKDLTLEKPPTKKGKEKLKQITADLKKSKRHLHNIKRRIEAMETFEKKKKK